jgi:hypothetical protein
VAAYLFASAPEGPRPFGQGSPHACDGIVRVDVLALPSKRAKVDHNMGAGPRLSPRRRTGYSARRRPAIVIGSNTDAQWSSSGVSMDFGARGSRWTGLCHSLPRSSALPRIPAGGFHSKQEIAAPAGSAQAGCGRSARSVA